MACTSCKKSKQEIVNAVINETKVKQNHTIKNYIINLFLFLFFLVILTPVIFVIFVVALFKVVVLSKEINLLPLVYHIGKTIFKEKEEDDDEDDIDDEFDAPLEEFHELAEPDEIIELK
jgi:hypothetical protein